MLTTTFLVRACAAHKPVNFINQLFLRCTVPFSIKEVYALSLIPSFIVLLLKGCLGLLQDLLYRSLWQIIDFQPLGFDGGLGHASGLWRFFSLLPAYLMTLRTIHIPFSESAQFCFLSTGLALFPCAWFLFDDGCHLYEIYDIYSYRTFTVSLVFLCCYFRVIFFKCYILQ